MMVKASDILLKTKDKRNEGGNPAICVCKKSEYLCQAVLLTDHLHEAVHMLV
jgi:hypothetical protein